MKPRHNSHKDLILSGGEASSIATASAPTTVGGALLEPIYADLNKTRQDIAVACSLHLLLFQIPECFLLLSTVVLAFKENS